MTISAATPDSMRAPADGATIQPPRWIVGAGFDQWFLLIGWSVPFALWGLSLYQPMGLVAAGLTFLILDRAHLWATAPLTFLDRQTMRQDWPRYLMGLTVLAMLAIQATIMGGYADAFWGSIVLYWGAFHIIRQHYGFLRLYQSRSGVRDERLVADQVGCLYSGTLFPYLLNLSLGWAARGQEGQAFRLVILPIPQFVPWATLAVFVYYGLRLLIHLARCTREGKRIDGLPLLFLFLAVSNFWVAGFGPGRTSLLVGIIFITSFHNLQYIGLVWYVGRKRYSVAADERQAAGWCGPLFVTPLTFLTFIVAGSVLYVFLQGLLPVGRELFMRHAVEMHLIYNLILATAYAHYLFDGWLWQMRSNPRLRRELGLTPARPA